MTEKSVHCKHYWQMARELLITQRERRLMNASDGLVMMPDTTEPDTDARGGR